MDNLTYHVVVVDHDGNHPALVFQEPIAGKAFRRALLIDRETAAPQWFENDDGELPHRELEEGDTEFTPEKYGVTWHFAK